MYIQGMGSERVIYGESERIGSARRLRLKHSTYMGAC